MKIMNRLVSALMVVLVTCALSYGQNTQPGSPVLVQAVPALYSTIAISATAAVNVVSTLTIPAPPPGQYNYVCSLGFNASQNGTSTANTNAVSSSTNFNSFALKWSLPATANLSYDWYQRWGEPSTGCVKSTSPGTATTFVSPQTAQTAYTWYATYFQAP